MAWLAYSVAEPPHIASLIGICDFRGKASRSRMIAAHRVDAAPSHRASEPLSRLTEGTDSDHAEEDDRLTGTCLQRCIARVGPARRRILRP
jgi:hypothetical protein